LRQLSESIRKETGKNNPVIGQGDASVGKKNIFDNIFLCNFVRFNLRFFILRSFLFPACPSLPSRKAARVSQSDNSARVTKTRALNVSIEAPLQENPWYNGKDFALIMLPHSA